MWEVDSGREVWRASQPLLSLPDKDGVTLVNQMVYSKALESVVMTTYDHSILFAKTSSMKIWKQVLYCTVLCVLGWVGGGRCVCACRQKCIIC